MVFGLDKEIFAGKRENKFAVGGCRLRMRVSGRVVEGFAAEPDDQQRQ